MLGSLYIKNIAIIDELSIEFHNGMTSVTGETGAGKSIVVDALALALGARADQALIKHGCKVAEVIAEFELSDNQAARSWLENQNLQLDEPQCILKRQLFDNKASKSIINDRPVTAALLNELGQLLVNICGQQEYLNLVNPMVRLAVVDTHAQTAPALKQIRSLYNNLTDLNQQIEHFENSQGENENQLDLLNFMVDELEQGDFSETDYRELDAQQKRLAHNSDIVAAVAQSMENLGSLSSENVLNLLNQSTKLLAESSKYEPRLNNVVESLNSANIACEEALNELTAMADRLELDPEQLQNIEQRLSNYHQLARKHRCEPAQLQQKLETLRQRLDLIRNADEQLEVLNRQKQAVLEQYHALAAQITVQRVKSAKTLSASISKQLQQLNLKGAICKIECVTDKSAINPKGQDAVRFLISTNKGQPPGPIEKIASGGELSRVGLAIQLETSRRQGNAVLIFDEVDTGISGKTADIVGDKLKQLAKQNQTICITHLPQVACKAGHQLRVTKDSKRQSRLTLDYLDIESRITELARFLSGKNITDESLANARVMLEDSSR